MQTLLVTIEKSGEVIGRIVRTDAGDVDPVGDTAAGIFRQVKRRFGGTDAEVFDALATGWSNGYVVVRAREGMA